MIDIGKHGPYSEDELRQLDDLISLDVAGHLIISDHSKNFIMRQLILQIRGIKK